MIDRETIDRIFDAAKIVDVVSEFVTLKRTGASYKGLCPFHADRNPSFSVNPAKNICKCFVCGKGGSPVNFLMEYNQWTYPEALKWLANKYGIPIQERELTPEELKKQTQREGLFNVNKYAQKQFEEFLLNTDEGRNVGLAYFRERGFLPETIRAFGLGYCPKKRDAFAAKALADGQSEEYLVETGLCMKYDDGRIVDRFSERVIFPVFNRSGNVVAFGGRILRSAEKLAKYVNSPESEIYHKSNELYGLFQAKSTISKKDRCFLVEGYTDVISMHQAGIKNVVASSGTALTDGQIKQIRNFTDNITVLYDGDSAGIKASLRGIDMLLRAGMQVKVLLLPDGDDPDSFSRKHTADEFEKYLDAHQIDFIRFKANLMDDETRNDPQARIALIEDICRSIACINNSLKETVYVQETSNMFGLPVADLTKEVNRQKTILRAETARTHTPPTPTGTASPAQQTTPAQPASTTPASTTPASTLTASPNQPNQPETAAVASTPAPQPTYPLRPFERELMRYIVRYGDVRLSPDTVDEAGVVHPSTMPFVIEYISQRLTDEQILFTYPLYIKMYEQVFSITPGRRYQDFFLNHEDAAIRQEAFAMVDDKYELSKIHTKYQNIPNESERLCEFVPRAFMELQDAIVREEMNKINDRIKELNDAMRRPEADSASLTTELMMQMTRVANLNGIRIQLAKELGERIVAM
jgi:DNA primase